MSALDVIIVSWRCERLLRCCLASLREHPASRGIRVHVVDNCSGDGTAEMIAAEFPEVELTVNDSNLGFSAANNIALRRTDAEYALALNPDTQIIAGALDRLLALMDAQPEVGICGPRLERADGSFDHASRRSFPTPLSALGHFSGIGRRQGGGPLADYRAPEVKRGPADAVNGAFMLIRRQALDDIGLFDEGYWMYMEDLDLCYRAKQAGWQVFFEPTVTVLHEKAGTSGADRSLRLNWAFHRGMGRFYRRHYAPRRPAPLNLAVYAGICSKFAASAARVAARRRRSPDDRPASLPANRPPSRTLVVFHVAELSGPSVSLREPLAWLSEHGELEVAVPGPGPAADFYADIATVSQHDYRVLTLPQRMPLGLTSLISRSWHDYAVFRRHIQASRPELVIAVTAMIPAVLLAARRERVPALLHADEILIRGRSHLRTIAGRVLTRATGAAASAIAACSETVADQYRSTGHNPGVVYPPIPDAFGNGDGSAFRDRHGIPADVPLVLCVGNISKGRGQDLLIEAAGQLRKRFPGLTCALVGVPFQRAVDIAYERRLRELAELAARSEPSTTTATAASPPVVLCGFEPRIADAYAAADAVVNPARDPEAFGRVCCEALTAMRPVVATRVGAIPEILIDEKTALLVPPGDPSALAAAIGQLLADPADAHRLAEAGRHHVLDRFNPARSLADFKRLVALE